MIKVFLLSLLLISCTGAKTSTGLVASTTATDTTFEKTDKVEIVNNNQEMPEWALWYMGGATALIILFMPSPAPAIGRVLTKITGK